MGVVARPATTAGADAGRLRRRAARTGTALDVLGAELGAWLAARRADPVFHRFASHLEILETVLTRMLDRLRAELAGLGEDVAAGYEGCRRVDRGLATLRRLFAWYAGKYDQRRDGGRSAVLRAADELARSCWSAAFGAAGRKPPTGPLCFVDNRADAYAARRCEVPSELLPAIDDPVAEFVARLPIPVIALPEPALRESWWLVLAAHETGHHVLADLGLAPAVKEALRVAAGPVLAPEWIRWHNEVFADLYSVLMVGPAAAWAVDELQYGSRAHLLRPRGGYPAPLVRLALIGEILKALGAPDDVPDAVTAVGDAAVAPHLAVLPEISRALLDIPLGDATLRSLAHDEVVAGGKRLRAWSEQLVRPEPVIGDLATGKAPRVLIAAAVHRYRALTAAGDDEGVPALHDGLLSVLPRSGVPGVLAPPGEAAIEELADALGELLVERTGERESA